MKFEKSIGTRLPALMFIGAYFLLIVNVDVAFGIQKANALEKAAIIAAFMAIGIKDGFRRSNVVLAAFALLITAACAAASRFDMMSWERYLRGAVGFSAFLAVFCIRPGLNISRTILTSVAWLPLSSILLGALYQAIGISGLFGADHTGAIRLAGSMGAALLGGAAFAGSVASAVLMAHGRTRCKWLLGLNLAIAFLTGSRMASATALVASIGILTLTAPTHSLRMKRLLSSTLATLLLAGVFGGSLIHRFHSSSLSGRDVIHNAIEPYHDMYPGFGIGLGHQTEIMPVQVMKRTFTIAAHDEYFRLLVELGWVGSLSISFALLLMVFIICRDLQAMQRNTFLVVFAMMLMYAKTDNALSVTMIFIALLAAICKPETSQFKLPATA